VRGITGTLVVLLAIGYIASSVKWSTPPHADEEPQRLQDGWRRTAQGWEQRASWVAREPIKHVPCVVHPWTVAALQVLFSLLALLLARPAGDRKRPPRVKPPHVDASRSECRLHPSA